MLRHTNYARSPFALRSLLVAKGAKAVTQRGGKPGEDCANAWWSKLQWRRHKAEGQPIAADMTAIRHERLIVIERRALVRGCLTCWLGRYFEDLETAAVADVDMYPEPDTLVQIAAVIIGAGRLAQNHGWLHRQIAWLRAKRPDLPIMVIVEADEIGAAADLCAQLDLQGYIPSFSSLEVAAAAVRLVLAGGTYFPRPREHASQSEQALPAHIYQALDLAKTAELTSREWAVVSLLGSGVPNKDIADRLGMSLSTVKAHVHHVIRKLNVRNRTEVALLTQFLRPRLNGVPSSADYV
jgi:DNA-binding NarL/FixJ family response regulator